MALLALLALAMIVSLLLGGKLSSLAAVHFRHSYLVLIALGIQILVFSGWWRSQGVSFLVSDMLYVASLVILAVAIWLNRHVPGMWALGLGLALNTAVIMVNGGHMPARIEALSTAGIASSVAEFEALHVTNSCLITPGTPLWFLGDVFAIPAWLPLANVFSVGDVLIALGGAWFIIKNSRPGDQEAP